MARINIFIIVLFLFGNAYAQKDSAYFTKIAGDSTLSSGKYIYASDIGDTVKLTLHKGVQRLVFSEGIKVNDGFAIQLFNSAGQRIEYKNHDTHIDFHNDTRGDVYLLMTTVQPIEEELVGKLFWVYAINFKGDAPDFSLTDIYGISYSNESLLGKIVVFNFWGIWCKPCVKEIPQLNKLAKYYSNRDDIIFLAVSSDSEKSLKKFIKRKKFGYNQVSYKDAMGLSAQLMDLGMYGVPVHIVLDKKGNVVFRFLGDSPGIDKMLTKSIQRQL